VICGERPDRAALVAAPAKVVERRLHERTADTPAPGRRRDEERSYLPGVCFSVPVAAGAARGEAHKLIRFLGDEEGHGGVAQLLAYELRPGLGKGVARGQERGERLAGRLLPEPRPGLDVPRGGAADVQEPPAIAGRMTIVSPSETSVWRPSSTRTSSSLR